MRETKKSNEKCLIKKKSKQKIRINPKPKPIPWKMFYELEGREVEVVPANKQQHTPLRVLTISKVARARIWRLMQLVCWVFNRWEYIILGFKTQAKYHKLWELLLREKRDKEALKCFHDECKVAEAKESLIDTQISQVRRISRAD